MRKKVIQILLIVCLVLITALGGCARSETSVPSPTPAQPKEPVLKPAPEEITPKPILDSDGDGFSDWFEENIAITYDPNIPNDRYVIEFECWEEGLDNDGADRAWHFFREVAGVPAENIIVLKDKEAIYSNLRKAIEEVAAKADENDIVCLDINAHGGGSGIVGYPYLDQEIKARIKARTKADPNFCPTDYVREHGHPGYPGIEYAAIDKWLDEVKAKVIIISVCACGFGKNGVPVLKDGHCPRIIPRGPSYYYYLDPSPGNTAFVRADENGNRDGYVSMEEVKYYVNYIFYKDDPDYWNYREWVTDTSNIASEIYLTDPQICLQLPGNP